MDAIRDLGELNDPLILFGGPYSNLQALEALLSKAREYGIETKHIISAGDVVAYCANGQECVDLIRDANIHVVAGNCEQQLALEADECGCGFEEGSTCSILSHGWYPHALNTVSQDAKNWMGMLPRAIIFKHCGKSYAVIHGGVSDISKFLWSTSAEEEFRREISAFEGSFDCIFAAHSGIAFERRFDAWDWVNVGAIGMPENDGDPNTRFVLLQNGKVSIKRLAYDFESAAKSMEAAGLTQGYETALRTGYWPSEDVLPIELRKQSRAG